MSQFGLSAHVGVNIQQMKQPPTFNLCRLAAYDSKTSEIHLLDGRDLMKLSGTICTEQIANMYYKQYIYIFRVHVYIYIGIYGSRSLPLWK